MVGQKELVEKVNNITLDTMPHSIMLVGRYGCGKHTLIEMLADKLSLRVVNITTTLELETINEICERPEPYIYIINGDEITEKEESVILKFLEEPLKNAFIIVFTTNKNFMLKTIINRCVVWEFKPYTYEELRQFTKDKCLLTLAETPGEILSCNNHPVGQMFELSKKILEYINSASVSNILTLADKLDYNNSGTGYPADIFFKMLRKKQFENLKESSAEKYNEHMFRYDILNGLVMDSRIPNIDKRKLFEKSLLRLKSYNLC